MLYLETGDVQVFKVALYNKQVRALVRQSKTHDCFSDQWAKLQERDVIARDEAEVRLLIAERFPPEDGFVVADISPQMPEATAGIPTEEFTEEEWSEIKTLALEQIIAANLDTPNNHLHYIQERLTTVRS